MKKDVEIIEELQRRLTNAASRKAFRESLQPNYEQTASYFRVSNRANSSEHLVFASPFSVIEVPHNNGEMLLSSLSNIASVTKRMTEYRRKIQICFIC